MAYQSGSVQNTFELYDAFAEWMTGSAGWNLQATTNKQTAGTGSASMRDQVFFSSGSDGANALTYRTTFVNSEALHTSGACSGITASAVNYDPADYRNVFDHIVLRGYLNWEKDDSVGGTSSFSHIGPLVQTLPRRGDYVYAPHPYTTLNYSSSEGRFNEINAVNERFYNYAKTGDSAW